VSRSGLLPLDPVLQNPDLFDFELDRIAVFEIPAELEVEKIGILKNRVERQ
jgi:hypothetical protein